MSLTRIINKTPLANEKSNIYEIDNIDSPLLNQIVKSRFIGEGVYSLEQFSLADYKEQYLTTPSFDKFSYATTLKEWDFKSEDIKELTIYELELAKPTFMPIDVKQFADVFNSIGTIPDASIFVQVLLCKRVDDFRKSMIQSYTSFLKGNESPIDNKIVIKLQEKMINVFAKISDYQVKRDQIQEMEDKILSNNYRFECRFIVFEQKYVTNFLENMEKTLQKLTLFNEIRLKTVKNKRDMIKLIENREFHVESVNQLLSEQELYSLLCADKPNELAKTELPKPTQKQSMSRSLEDSMLLQKAIQLMPFSKNKNVEVDESKAQQINQAFMRVGVINKKLKINQIHQGSTLLKVQMVIPPELTFTGFTKKLTDIKSALGNENVSLEFGEIPDTLNVYMPLENRGVLYFRDILESDQFKLHKEKYPLPFILGESVNGELLFSCLAELAHILIAGATKSGKSVFVNLIILSLILSVPPDELALYLVDPKQVEYTFFDGFPQVKEIITNMKKADALLGSLVNEMEKRYELFAKSGVKNISSYNKNNEQKMPYVVVAIDEYSDLVMVNPNVEEHLIRLGQKARAAGIHLIICTQKPLADIVTSVLKSNLPSAISFRLKTSSDYSTVFGKGIPYNLLGKGDGVARLEGQHREFERFQSPILTIDEEKEDEIYQQMKELFKDAVVNQYEIDEVVIEEPIDKLKRIIATKGDLRISSLQENMGIAIGKVHAIIQELVDEEWLIQLPNKRYQINVDQEELDRWRNEE